MIGRLHADGVVQTDAERAALQALRSATGELDGPMERHCLRLLVIAERLGGESLDREVVSCASWLHDIGLYLDDRRVYVTTGRNYAVDLLAAFGWSPSRMQLCLDAIEHHHELRDQSSLGAEVEAVRRADLIDVGGLLVGGGLSRGWLRGLYRAVPRAGLYREIGGEVARMAIERPLTLPQIFAPG